MSADILGRLIIVVLNRIPFATPHFVEKKFLRQKTRKDENRSAFRPIFRHMGRVLEGAVIVVTVECLLREGVVVSFW
ncbi:hypothetical protein VSX61_12060 [Brenneria populi subsp. brevivirga]|uniref:hypothetical protein n=1 Tax=Brenneria populi TaxID=1505588 RepID=UPI002E192C7A|nr:hypothetical protein [Brenneria populi subsp. brevivirga]